LGKRLNWTKVEDHTLRQLARSGMLAGEIAARMGISVPTIRVHAAKLRIPIAKASTGRFSKKARITVR
jgi:DNA-binding CsgD family transcriptional regulator